MSSIIKESVWATRYQSDGRCDYRKEQGNSPKRSLSLENARREKKVTSWCVRPPSWVKPTDWGRPKSPERGCCGYATAVVTSSLNFKAGGFYA